MKKQLIFSLKSFRSVNLQWELSFSRLQPTTMEYACINFSSKCSRGQKGQQVSS